MKYTFTINLPKPAEPFTWRDRHGNENHGFEAAETGGLIILASGEEVYDTSVIEVPLNLLPHLIAKASAALKAAGIVPTDDNEDTSDYLTTED